MPITAQLFLDRGFKVLPIYGPMKKANGSLVCACEQRENCPSPMKHPLTSNGVHDATNNLHIIKAWLKKYPSCNFGVATGAASGVMVIDVDYQAGGLESLRHLPETSTWRCKTGNGHHMYFQYREGLGNKVGVYPGIDIRSDSGYVLIPPSQHYTGRYYTWIKATLQNELAQIDDSLFELILTKAKDVQGDYEDYEMIIPEGRRNKALHYFGSTMRGKGFSMNAIAAALREENRIKCSPPLSDWELDIILNSVSQYSPGHSGLGVWY